ncbi:MAG: M20 family peptidase [Polyangia bacterium]
MAKSSIFRRTVTLAGLGIGTLFAVVTVRTLTLTSKQPRASAPTVPELGDGNLHAERLGQAIRFRTVSQDGQPPASAEFDKLHAFVRQSFPKVHATLQHETVGGLSLLYKWQGSDPQAKPILLLAHQDVVPVDPVTESRWHKAPFGGELADGFVWGRGSLDDKCSMMAIFESVELLLTQGFAPRRTVYLAFGHDEEAVSAGGASQIAALLHSRGVQLELTLDEGLTVLQGMMPGVTRPVALVGVSEKGFINVEIEAAGEGGHSSMPPKQTLIGRLGRALARLEEHQMDASLLPPTSDMFDFVAPEMSWPLKPIIANRWLFGPILRWQLEQANSTRALLQTTQAPTMLSGSPKSNVLPQSARATINYRIRPGNTTAQVVEHVRNAVHDDQVKVAMQPGSGTEPSPVSDVHSAVFSTFGQTIVSLFPDALVAPGLMIGASDGRHFAKVSDSVYRFVPMVLAPEDLARLHGTDERIRQSDYLRMIRFYAQLVQNLDGTR